jgi:hypothetical protein
MKCDVLTKIGMTLVNKLIGTTERAQNVGYSVNGVVSNQNFFDILF